MILRIYNKYSVAILYGVSLSEDNSCADKFHEPCKPGAILGGKSDLYESMASNILCGAVVVDAQRKRISNE